MSSEIINVKEQREFYKSIPQYLTINSYWGGRDKGKYFEFIIGTEYCQLTKEQVFEIVDKLKAEL